MYKSKLLKMSMAFILSMWIIDASTVNEYIAKKQISQNNIGIKQGFSCSKIRQVPREVLKTEASGRGFQHLPRDLVNIKGERNLQRYCAVK